MVNVDDFGGLVGVCDWSWTSEVLDGSGRNGREELE